MPATLTAAGLEALADVPPTAKDELRAAQAEALPGRPLGPQQAVDLADLVQIVSSSGTTGRPLYYGLTRRDVETWAETCAQTFFTAGFRPGDVVAHLVGLPMVAGGLPYADGFRRLGAALAWVGGFSTERILAALPTLQASGLLATTSFGVYLVEAAERLTGAPASALGIRKLQLGGEPGLSSPSVRARVEAGWGTSHVREGMGLADVLAAMWSECEAKAGMHYNGQRSVVIELVDPEDGSRLDWTEGARGEILYTTFEREATPVVRYRSADHVVVTGVDCACGRTSPRISVLGRTDDMLIYKGMNVFPAAIREVALAVAPDSLAPTIRIWKDEAAQVQFLRPIPLEVEALPGVPPEDWPDVVDSVTRGVREHLQVRVDVTVLPPHSLPRSAHKTPLVVIRTPLDGDGAARSARTEEAPDERIDMARPGPDDRGGTNDPDERRTTNPVDRA